MKETNWEAKAQISGHRHETIRTAIVAIAVICILGTAIGGCTVYNVKKLDRPIDYSEKYEQNYSRQ